MKTSVYHGFVPWFWEKQDREFERQVRKDLAFLFIEHGAQVIENRFYWRSFGSSIIIVVAENLKFQFLKDGKDSVRYIKIGARHIAEPTYSWYHLENALRAVAGTERIAIDTFVPIREDRRSPTYRGFLEMGRLIQDCFAQLNAAFSPEHFEATRSKL